MEVDRKLVQIIREELGTNSADLFIKFYKGFPKHEQVEGARELLDDIIGRPRTNFVLQQFKND